MAKKKKTLDIENIDTSGHPEDNGELSPGPGKESFKLAAFWKSQVEMVDKSQTRWFKRGDMVLKRYRDERGRGDEDSGQRRMNLLWANVKVMKPAIYSRCPIPIVDRKFLDRDPTGRLSSQMLERSIINELSNDFHEAMTGAVYDRLLPGRGVVWPRYEPTVGDGPSVPAASPGGIEDALVKIGEDTGDEDLITDDQKEESLQNTNQQVISEKVVFDYVNWRDLYLFPAEARTWSEVQAVGKRVCISKKEAKDRFGNKIGGALRPDTTPLVGKNSQRQSYSDAAVFHDINERNIVVYEIWNKSDQRVYWISTGYEYLCDVKDDPLELTGFLPIAKPLYATTTSDTLIPVPDYIEWQDQAIQIDELTKRIAMLTKACKIVGAYNASNDKLNTIFNESVENQLIPVDQWAMFAEAGGLKGAIDFVPIDQIQSCIQTLQTVRQQCMIDLDQITGLSDIMRGTSDSRETLGGIRLKNNNAGTRLSDSQEEVARFAKDTINIAAEIISKHFSDDTIIESSGILYEEELQPDAILREWEAQQTKLEKPQPPAPNGPAPIAPMGPAPGQTPPNPALQALGGSPQGGMPPMPPGVPGASMGAPPQEPIEPEPPDVEVLIIQKIEKALALLRKDVMRSYRISIETDSTIFGDKVQERQDATEFVGAVGGFMKQFETVAGTVPEAMPLLGKMLQWAVRKYRTGRDLESEIDSFVLQMEKKAKDQVENPQPDPEQQKANAEIEKMQMQMQMEAENDKREQERQHMNDMRDAQLQQQDDERKAQLENMKAGQEREKMQMEMTFARQSHALEMDKLNKEAEHSERDHHFKMEQLKVTAEENNKKRAEAKRKSSQPKKKAK